MPAEAMTALQTERFYPQLATGHPVLDTATRHAWTGLLAAGCTATVLTAGLCAAGTITTALAVDPIARLVWAPTLGGATWRLGRYTWLLARTLKARA